MRVSILILLMNCTLPATVHACEYDERHFDPTWSQLKGAVELINLIVNTPALFMQIAGDPEVKDPDPEAIPVHLTTPEGGRGLVASVPAECRAIVIDGNEFEKSYQNLSKNDVLLQGNEMYMLALLLLHELGHIQAGHYGAFIPVEGAATTNLDSTNDKKREEQADEFVGAMLRTQFLALEKGEAIFTSVPLMALVSSLSFTISTRAALDCYPCRVIGSPELFWDYGQSHPNLQLRLMMLDHRINPTATSQEILDDFLEMRGR